jgi:hypothetical protein
MLYEAPKDKMTTEPNEATFYFLAKETEFRKLHTEKLLQANVEAPFAHL